MARASDAAAARLNLLHDSAGVLDRGIEGASTNPFGFAVAVSNFFFQAVSGLAVAAGATQAKAGRASRHEQGCGSSPRATSSICRAQPA